MVIIGWWLYTIEYTVLFKEMVKHAKTGSQIICTDLSFIILKYDRLRAKKLIPGQK